MPFLRLKTCYEKCNFVEKRKWYLKFYFERKNIKFHFKIFNLMNALFVVVNQLFGQLL